MTRRFVFARSCAVSAVLILLSSAASAQVAPLCEGDADGDGVVNFADLNSTLSNWLNDYTPLTGPGDADLSGVVDFVDINAVLGNWLNTCQIELFALATPESGHVDELTLEREGANDLVIPATYRLHIGAEQLDQGLITLEMFSITAQVPDAGAGIAPPVILSFWTDPKFEAQVVMDTFEMPIRMMSSSVLIDRVAPPIGGPDSHAPLRVTEAFDGVLMGRFFDDPGDPDRRQLELNVTMLLDPARAITGDFPAFTAGIVIPLLNINRPLGGVCSPADFRILRQVMIRPVFFQITPGRRTGESFEDLRTAAREIWLKCCIDLVFLEPMILEVPDGVDLKAVTQSQAEDLLNGFYDFDALEVIFVEGFDDPTLWGGAVATHSSRGADGRCVFSDGCMTGADPGCNVNTNAMSHELGHLFGLCHPGDEDCPPELPIKGGDEGYNQGTTGTCMEPSGAAADNPSENSRNNCDNACCNLMTTRVVLCCRRPEL